jgi:hypothetical protein
MVWAKGCLCAGCECWVRCRVWLLNPGAPFLASLARSGDFVRFHLGTSRVFFSPRHRLPSQRIPRIKACREPIPLMSEQPPSAVRPGKARHVSPAGDVRRLAGRAIEIHSAVKLYDGRPEIILNRISQITGGAAMIPPAPQKLRRRKSQPLQRRTPAPYQETSEGQGQAQQDGYLRQRCRGRRAARVS